MTENLKSRIASLEKQNIKLVAQLEESNHRLDAILSSSSWRITAPLRITVNQIKRIKSHLSLCLKKASFRLGLANRDSGASMLHPATQDSNGHDQNDYSEWIRRYDTLTDKKRMYMRRSIDNFSNKPSVSIIMPTYNPKIEWLMAAIESVKKQIYPYWELCIADDASTDAAIRTILEKYAKEDSRIKVVFREQNGHISAATNSALELASHPWLALMDHDDVLPEHALYYVADVIDKNDHIKLIYSDEDKIDLNGNRCHPYFKCDWNVNLFLSQNLITHIGVYRSDIAREIGGFRLGYEGAQDYDFALRYIEKIESGQIYHIPRILYHWRSHENSTAQSLEAKPYGLIAGEKALNDYFLRNRIAASVTATDYGYRTSYSITGQYPKVSVIIPTRNALDLLKQCIESILEKTSYPDYEVLIIDNGSDDEATLKYLKTLVLDPRIQVLRDDGPFNYSALNNAAVKKAAGEYVLLLNNDIEVISSEWMEEMVSIAIQPNIGVVGARLWYPDNTLQHGGVILGIGGVAGHAHKHLPVNRCGYFSRAQLTQTVSAVTAACLLVRKEIYTEVGGLDEINLKVAFNDIDFCLRVRQAGYKNIWTPYAELYHHESATRGHEITPEKKERFQTEARFMLNQWDGLLLSDPAYNPNLSLNSESFSLAWPPRIDALNINEY